MSRESKAKFKELVLYISQKSANDVRFGSTKLNKLLLFSDMWHFANSGSPITDASYIKQDRGPVPNCLVPVRAEMIEQDHTLALVPKTEVLGKTRIVPTALRAPNLSVFSGEEIATTDYVIDLFADMNNTEISDYSHKRIANWDYFKIGQTIPLGVILFPAQTKLTSEEKSFFRNLLETTTWGKKLLVYESGTIS